MKVYLLSLGAGLLVGVIYSLLNVRSPAPPLVALVGLLGILAGEQIVPVARQMIAGHGLAAAWRQAKCAPHMFGMLPGRSEPTPQQAARVDSPEKHS
ncbi:MAG: XapX domain-containing protein [Rhodopseudomonas palustris]|uniref:XapX domain-containing protein n=1 Tax=Rhodopseudomonas palustris TaxID=1076 RepID=A0A933S2V5_RHOPL|nr:XapX domain-containing protein [Rhodopseudomonas palustris]